MLVYKTIENNETKFYGVSNDSFFANELVNDYKNAKNAGLIDFECLDNKAIDKLINLTVENITTMRQAFEVYYIMNNQSLKDTRNDFRVEMEFYCDDDKPEAYYRVATLNDFKDVMFDNVTPGYWEINSLLDWLKTNINDFEFNIITGCSQGEACAFYKFSDNNDVYLSLDEDVLMSIYLGVIRINVGLSKDEHGHPILNSEGENVVEDFAYLDEE